MRNFKASFSIKITKKWRESGFVRIIATKQGKIT
jgi:ribosomal protein L34